MQSIGEGRWNFFFVDTLRVRNVNWQ